MRNGTITVGRVAAGTRLVAAGEVREVSRVDAVRDSNYRIVTFVGGATVVAHPAEIWAVAR